MERHLAKTWLLHQGTKELGLDKLFKLSYNLRHRMHHFCQNYVYYIVVEVLEPNYYKFNQKLQEVKTIDEILDIHSNFLDECLKECLLTDQNLLKILIKIFQCCFFLSRITHKYTQSIQEDEAVVSARSHMFGPDDEDAANYCDLRQHKIDVEREAARKTVSEESYKSMINKFSNTFDEQLKGFMNEIKASHYEPHIAGLLMRLDFNSFYENNLLSKFAFPDEEMRPAE